MEPGRCLSSAPGRRHHQSELARGYRKQDLRAAHRWQEHAPTRYAGVTNRRALSSHVQRVGMREEEDHREMEHKMSWGDAPDDAGYVHRIAIRLAFAGLGLGRHLLQVVLVPKGQKLMLVDDDATEHIIQIGSWTSSGMPELQVEPGAPVVRALSLKNGSAEIGPFSTAGVFHLYCTIHRGMNLTMVVQ